MRWTSLFYYPPDSCSKLIYVKKKGYFVKLSEIIHNRDYVIFYICITKKFYMSYKCHNFRKDRDGQWSCWSTHICYKPFCIEGDLFSPALTIYCGRVMTIEEKEKLINFL